MTDPMRAFSFRRGEYLAELDPHERTIISRVIADTSQLLGVPLGRLDEASELEEASSAVGPSMTWSADDVSEPADPALARLLPSASKEDDGVADEFRRLTEADLRSAKAARLRMVFDELRRPGTKIHVPTERAMDWAAALTDVRLVLAERLGIRTDSDAEDVYRLSTMGAEADEDEIREALALLYSALTWLQESLLQVMLPTLPD
ncbi:DUF2017 domain-containing protein [Occultella gossypii]|uniref:DUF2017 domain-containing protein n=1 Tax=Occultella gossypii TaxID=2800820 RepID=A0ABS7S7D6_9MICO|nr:DUF2017 domain-containing protein [Occultella gossypii]MBZ2196261.1 DUF2017 domain-containing protein [Occultella gossypii]